MNAASLDIARLHSAVDLASPNVVAQARRRRRMIALAGRVREELALINQRASYLDRQARRLPIASNGRARCTQDAADLRALAATIAEAFAGTTHAKIRPPANASRHAQRAASLLNDLQAA